MNLEDESLLTAYIDDELEEQQRLAVEAALLSDAGVAERLRQLIAVRDVVDALARPGTSHDMVIPVLDRIAATRWRRAVLRLVPASRPGRVATTVAACAAAALLFAATLFLNLASHRGAPLASGDRRPHAPVTAPTRSHAHDSHSSALIARSDVQEPRAVASKAGAGASQDRVASVDHPADRASHDSAPRVAAGPDAEEVQSDAERLRLQGLLFGEPNVRRVLVTGDSLEATASQVDGLLRNAPRRKAKYSRITVNQGIVVDPRNPASAVVFLVVMDDKELGYLRKSLKTEFHLSVRDDGPAPASVVTLLADIGQVSVAMGTPAATLMAPPEDMASSIAMRARGTPELPREVLRGPGFRVPGSRMEPAATDAATASPAQPASPEETTPASPAAADRLATVLVWVNAREESARE